MTQIYEIDHASLGFILLLGTAVRDKDSPTVLQFFRHYGHPIRISFMDRAREVLGIVIVYLFVLYFPVGLLLSSWMRESSQYLWLGHQLYCVVAMHVVRVLGMNGCASSVERAAQMLHKYQEVTLRGSSTSVRASLQVEHVRSMGEGRLRVKEILHDLNAGLGLHED